MGEEYVLDDDSAKTQQKKQQHYTQEEIRNLTDTKNLFQSPLFRFSFAEVLKKASLNWKKCTKIEDALRSLKEILDSISQYKAQHLNDIYSSKFIAISDKTKKLACNAPQSIAIVGSYLLRTIAKPYKNIDVAVTMPKGFITSKDYGKTYFEKRAWYLCAMAEHLKKNEIFSQLEIIPFRGDYWKPIIVSNVKIGKNYFKIRIMPSITTDIFAKSLKPENIVEYHRIAEDQFFHKHLEMLHNEMKDCPVLVETAILLRVWARNRNIYQADDSLNGFLLSMLILYLLSQKKINKTMSSFQMIKLLMNWIVKSNDQEGDFNIFHRVSQNAWNELKSEAKLTLAQMKDETSVKSVELLFLTKHTFWHKFDAILNVSIPNSFKHDSEVSTKEKITSTLNTALEGRVKYLRVVGSDEDKVFVGLIFTKNWFEPLIKGPSPHNKEKTEAFKTFWGKKAFMKDFSDGSLSICTEWQVGEDERSVKAIERIANYVLKKHLDKNVDCSVSASDIYSLMKISKVESQTANSEMREAFEKLESIIMDTDIHLIPENICVISPEFYEVAITSPKATNPLLTVLQFRSNARWPDNIEALDKLKQLIYLKYSETLKLKTTPTRRWIDIVCNGFTFRVVVFVSKEINLIKRSGQALNPNVHELEKTLNILPLHCKYSGIFDNTFKEYAETVRLAKSWINTHFMSDYLEDSVVELLCMHVYTDVYSPYKAPKTAICAFFRFLSLLCSHSWFDTPLFVNTSIGDSDVESTQREFSRRSEEYEKLDTKPSMYIVASYNLDYVWTKKNPPAIIVHRMVQFAKNTEIELNEYILSPVTSSLPSLFTSTDMDGYDLIIKLKSEQEIRSSHTSYYPLDSTPTICFIGISKNVSLDLPQQASITNTWCMKPLLLQSSNNKNETNSSSSKNTSPSATNTFNKLQFNMEQFIFELEQLGKGIIHSIKANNDSLAPYFATTEKQQPTSADSTHKRKFVENDGGQKKSKDHRSSSSIGTDVVVSISQPKSKNIQNKNDIDASNKKKKPKLK
ncbi:hypothetical protein C9374_002637 [Naegleria lovaniensis]|uniref:Nucleolar protein 6 n=1 Tax=Naegleria lovaniensis TaxID=51637 RepID=A0AA88GPX0_NAELO|nr:uncharacterized protein C9374_002637 [Naegleria lovaniensis]KAG2386191.1 hypothetical protein C9374_002637 [Naegleria lovaniensis]